MESEKIENLFYEYNEYIHNLCSTYTNCEQSEIDRLKVEIKKIGIKTLTVIKNSSVFKDEVDKITWKVCFPYLAENAIKGDRIAFEKIFNHYLKIIYSICYSYTIQKDNSGAIANDLTQDVFIKIFKNLEYIVNKTQKIEQSFLAYCITIAKNISRDFLKKGFIDDFIDINNIVEIKDKKSMEDKEVFIELYEKTLDKYAENKKEHIKKREAVDMYYSDGISTSEISVKLDVPISTITTWLDRFRKFLKIEMMIKSLDQKTDNETKSILLSYFKSIDIKQKEIIEQDAIKKMKKDLKNENS